MGIETHCSAIAIKGASASIVTALNDPRETELSRGFNTVGAFPQRSNMSRGDCADAHAQDEHEVSECGDLHCI